ncbi:taurine ABC transporter [Corynebacterium aquilae DSM 44791]|uniref:Taurine ABC transporter n=1 Tax=Corynebacterium aquilae DSM 44791 TaxID=1431546 RepID=A0A1L7CGP9_9CORY|nr:taurine ABC transporter [Corynebacterium aquilae DSM 44791]
MPTPAIELRSVGQSYGKTTIIEPTTLTVEPGEFLVILGPSGCGKSTLLNIIAGLKKPTQGSAHSFGQPITGPGPDRAVVFQHHALLPWKTAHANITFGLSSARPELTREQRHTIADQALDMVGLSHAARRRPDQLSGGMQQRVGIARAFSLHSDILLLDEPFGALDALTRTELQRLLKQICAQQSTTAVLITHDVDEALYLADRIVVMSASPHASVIEDVRPAHWEHDALREHILSLLGYGK